MQRWNGVPEHWGRGYYRNVPVSRYVKLCRERQQRDLQRWLDNDPSFPFYFDWEESERAVWFMSLLRHFEGKFFNEPFELADWQEWDIVRPLFGWRKKIDHTRRFKEASVFIPKKNGKSALAAAIGAYLLIADKEYGAQVVCAATKEDQAKIVYEAARKMIGLSPELRSEIKTFRKSFINEFLGSRFFALGKDSKTSDGLNIHGGIVDEYHAHKTSEIRDIVRQGMATRTQPLFLLITTLGYGDSTPCDEEFELAKRILEGTVHDDHYLSFIATVDEPDRWDDEEEWFRANPNLGISIAIERFREDFESANKSPTKREEFKCKRLNIKGKKYGQWITITDYKACGGPIDWARFKGARAFGGLDLGITKDLSAFGLAFMDDQIEPEKTLDGEIILPPVYLKMRYWIPEEGMHERYRDDGVPYPGWVEEGWMKTTPGSATRYDIVRKDINDLSEEFEISQIAIDRAHAHQLMTDLQDDGHTIVKHAQTMMAMNMPVRQFEELILQGRLRHGDDPVLQWNIANVAIARDGNDNMKIVKDKSGDRVDGAVAAVMAVGLLLISPEPVYKRRGILAL